ncbi:TPA: hypothetical protein EYP38_05010, partial [Candidatus Micrarchaeota archaeon]|nr:hypothetical protein [Candidatus Micrarchaeota archaeon]
MTEVDLYDYGRRYRRNLELIEKDKLICKVNKRDIAAFVKMRLAKGSGYGRLAKVLYCLRNLAVWIKKPFRKATKNDLVALIGDLEGQGYAEHTKYDYKIVLKLFYKWLLGNDEDTPAIIKWLRPKLKNDKNKLPEELLTEEEVLRMAEAAENERDKAFVLVLYESGCRIGEILSLQLKNVNFDQFGAVIRVTGKTGDRRVRLVSSASTLASWMNYHPFKGEPDAMLWYAKGSMRRNRIACLSHTTVNQLLKIIAKKAGVKKNV